MHVIPADGAGDLEITGVAPVAGAMPAVYLAGTTTGGVISVSGQNGSPITGQGGLSVTLVVPQ